mmetsp:Transcript_29672/g.85079  ORF Transcript_29672/g.85079 Transcript_29672/m.85079 type:complete len:234 (-) Transcript_29672:72-773(-)
MIRGGGVCLPEGGHHKPVPSTALEARVQRPSHRQRRGPASATTLAKAGAVAATAGSDGAPASLPLAATPQISSKFGLLTFGFCFALLCLEPSVMDCVSDCMQMYSPRRTATARATPWITHHCNEPGNPAKKQVATKWKKWYVATKSKHFLALSTTWGKRTAITNAVTQRLNAKASPAVVSQVYDWPENNCEIDTGSLTTMSNTAAKLAKQKPKEVCMTIIWVMMRRGLNFSAP